MEPLILVRIFLGSALILFLPGLSWSFLLLRRERVHLAERVALSFGLSMVLMPLTVFLLHLTIGFKVTLMNVGLVALALSTTPMMYVTIREYLSKRERKQEL